MTVEECIAQIKKIDCEIAKAKGFDCWGLYVLKSNFTNQLIKLIKEMEGQLPPNKYSMRNTEMEELAENIRKIELSDYNIQPLLHLYITVKRMINKKRPELLNIKVEDER